MTIDTLSLDIKADSSAAVRSLNNLTEALRGLRDTAKGQTFKTVSEGVSNLFSSLSNISDEAITRVERLTSALERLSNVKISKTLQNIPSSVRSLNFNTVNQTPTDSGMNMPDASDVEKTVDTITNSEKKATKEGSKLLKTLNDIKKTTLGGLKNQFEGLLKPIKKLTSTFLRIGFYRLVRSLIKGITSSIKSGIDNLAMYSATINSSDSARANHTLSQLATSFNYLKNSIAAAVMPLIQQFTPAIVKVINLCVRAVNAINQLISALQGKTMFTRAKEVWIDYASTLDKTKKSAGALHHQLAQFDELNNLTAPGGSGASDDNLDYDFEDVAIASKWLEAAEKIKQAFQNIKDYALAIGSIIAGWKIAEGFWNLTSGAPTPIKIAGTLFITGVFVTLAGAILTWSAFLDSLKEGITSKISLKLSIGGILGMAGGGLMALGGGFLLKNMLVPLGAALTLVGTPIFASAFFDMFTNGLSLANSIFAVTGASMMGAGIGAIIGSIAGPLGAAYGAIIGSVVGSVVGGLSVLVAAFTTNYDTIHKKTVDFLHNLGLDGLANAIDKAFTKCKPFIDSFLQIIQDIKDGILGIKDAFIQTKEKLLETKSISDAWNTLTTGLSNAFQTMKDNIGGDLDAIKNKILEIINDIPILSAIANAFSSDNANKNRSVPHAQLSTTQLPHLRGYASGGFVGRGDLFVANEQGPELVGSLNGKTAVANNDMITDAIATATYNAMSKALSENNGNVRIVVEGNEEGIFKVWQKQQRKYERATGLAF